MLMMAGIQEILIITTPEDMGNFRNLLQDGSQWGLQFTYASQPQPRGLAEAFIIGKDFIGSDTVCLVLGDNLFFGTGLSQALEESAKLEAGATIFAYPVKDPQRYGVVEFDDHFRAISIEEKPAKPKSRFAVPGIYFYDNQVITIASGLTPSQRGELEITDINKTYLEMGKLKVIPLGRGIAWLDAGTHESLLQASSFVETVEERQGMMIACPEEIAFLKGYITADQLRQQAEKYAQNQYGIHLLNLLNDHTPRMIY